MQIFHNPLHHLHQGRHEMFRGRLVDCVETTQRLDYVLAELARRPLGELRTPGEVEFAALAAPLAQIHDAGYLEFIENAWSEWLTIDPENAALDVLPSVWPAPGMRRDVLPANFAGRLGIFSYDAGSPLTSGTWEAARHGAACAAGAARAVSAGAHAAFALTRPPGHHAGRAFFGGYCFLNNAAIAAQSLLGAGAKRVAILDIDYHHGNGTQEIFYERADVLTVSIHGDPRTEYPFFLGHADECGHGAGEGFNLNFPLARGTDTTRWRGALSEALTAISRFAPDALVLPLGVDTFEGDPISGFHLKSEDYFQIGRTIASGGWPTVITFEGGYAVAEVGINTVNLLEGYQDRRA